MLWRITLEFLGGTHIEDAIYAGIRMKNLYRRKEVVVRFNGVDVVIDGNKRISELVNKYRRMLILRRLPQTRRYNNGCKTE